MENELQVLLHAIQEAGQVVLNLRDSGLEINKKNNHDLVTQADLAVDAILKKHLLEAFPQDGWLSEETADNHHRLTCQRVWVVDPIDGTKEFSQGLSEFAISVALVEQEEPVLAVVFNPAKNELFHAIKNQGAWLNQKVIRCSHDSKIFLVSRSEYERGEWSHYEGNYQLKETGSIAYKLALVACGKAYATMTYNPRSEWDIAAGILLVQEAGGIVHNKLKQAFKFNQPDVRVNGVIAMAGEL